MRAAFFTLIGILTMATILVLPRDADAFSKVIIFTAIVVMGLSYIGLIVFPHEAMHTADSQEPEHAGLWRGVFTHKNIAGPIMACFSFAGLYLFRRGQTVVGRGDLLRGDDLHAAHRLQDDRRPGAVLDPDRRAAEPDRHAARHADPVCAGDHRARRSARSASSSSPPVKDLAATYFPDLTYTGRTTLWEFAGEMLAKRPWTGYGYESFWGTPLLLNQDQPFDRRLGHPDHRAWP